MGLLDGKWFKPPKENVRKLEAKANHYLKRKKVRRGKRKKHKRKIPIMSYRVYIKSSYWRQRKNSYFGKFGKRCAVCGQKEGVTLHHKRYKIHEFGKEPDDALVALCPHHHQAYHDHFGVQSNMTATTDLFVQHERQAHQFEQATAWLSNI